MYKRQLEYCADDYITKPFNILEVKARIKAIMRRMAVKQQKEEHNSNCLLYTSRMCIRDRLNNCIDAIENGVSRVHILDGRILHCLLLDIFTNKGIGTAILGEGEGKYYHEEQ